MVARSNFRTSGVGTLEWEGLGVDDLWATVDRLIHDLGAIRAFVDEAEAVPEASASPPVARVRGAMEEATTAITRVFDKDSSDEQRVVEAAWEALARAQDAVRAARAVIASARNARQVAAEQSAQAREQGARAREQADRLTQQRERRRRPSAPETPAGGDRSRD
jgi:hypothetical protein